MSLQLHEVARPRIGEDERVMHLDGEPILLAYAPHKPPGRGIVLAWATAPHLGMRGIADSARLLLAAYRGGSGQSKHGAVSMEFIIENVHYEALLADNFTGPDIFGRLQGHLYSAHDRLQLLRIAVDGVSIEWTFDERREPLQAAVVMDEVRMLGLVPCISETHSNTRVRSDREILLLALLEPGQIRDGMHILRPAQVIQ